MYFWNGIKQRWQKVGCVAFSQNDNKRLILGSLKRRRQRQRLNINSDRFRSRQHVFVFVWKTEKSVVIICSCTWENRSVHGLGKWCAKFRTGKFRSGIAFTICTNQFHLPKNGREGLKQVSKNGVVKNLQFCPYWNETRISVWNVPSRKTGLR